MVRKRNHRQANSVYNIGRQLAHSDVLWKEEGCFNRHAYIHWGLTGVTYDMSIKIFVASFLGSLPLQHGHNNVHMIGAGKVWRRQLMQMLFLGACCQDRISLMVWNPRLYFPDANCARLVGTRTRVASRVNSPVLFTTLSTHCIVRLKRICV